MKKAEISEFGLKSFDRRAMKAMLPNPIYTKWKQSVTHEEPMTRETADAIAHAMKTWAIENGATHYAHWFHPMTGASAEKHDAFIEPQSSGAPIFRFSGKNLIKGETDGSSFPNGGLRQTFEARGYTYWDVTSPAFVRGHVLFIPSLFVSYHGESLDEKTPLLKAMDALSKNATTLLNVLGDTDVSAVRAMVGIEQEYFLIDKEAYRRRDDLRLTGRTMLGSKPPKDQELLGHYFGAIPSKVVDFMEAVNEELWKLGIYAKVEHNEVAPRQYEIAVIYAEANIAVDQNMLVMETLKRMASKFDLVALLHEKPFKYVNGSGKHNNFSLVTDTGVNLFEPGHAPHQNTRFLAFVCALIRAVDTHPELLRFAASSAGNDHRLGAQEAPPAIISMFVGSGLELLFNQLETEVDITEHTLTSWFAPNASLSAIPKDVSDRNRTSPFAFTGNKFEFRMPGSSICSAFVNTVIATILSESIEHMIKDLNGNPSNIFKVCQSILKSHKRVLFNGDGYTQAWLEEAARRGLPNIPHYVDACDILCSPKTHALFESQHVFTSRELEARSEIIYAHFVEAMVTEGNTLLKMVTRSFIPAVLRDLTAKTTAYAAAPLIPLKTQIDDVTALIESLYAASHACEQALSACEAIPGAGDRAHTMQTRLRPHFDTIRSLVDSLELHMEESVYPFPSLTDILFPV